MTVCEIKLGINELLEEHEGGICAVARCLSQESVKLGDLLTRLTTTKIMKPPEFAVYREDVIFEGSVNLKIDRIMVFKRLVDELPRMEIAEVELVGSGIELLKEHITRQQTWESVCLLGYR